MTYDEMVREYKRAVESARQNAAYAVGKPVVVTLEAMGYRVVPAWVADMLEKILSKPPKA